MKSFDTRAGVDLDRESDPAAESSVPILVIDDNPAKRLALKAVLKPLGHPVVEAGSGVEGLRCIVAQDFAAILLDVCMPTMDGFETAALIRQRSQSEMTPIIFITAFGADDVTRGNRFAEGAVDFIFAPVDPDALRAKVTVFVNLFTKAASLARRADEVETSAKHVRLLIDAAPIGIFQTDSNNRYVYTNPRWSEITGMSAEMAAGRRWDVIIDVEQRSGLLAEFGDGVSSRDEFSRRFEIMCADSASRVVLVTSVCIPDAEGGAAGWVGTVADVTAEAGAEAAMSKARDQATAASRLKSDFLANMSHEIRTPMNGVIGMTELLLDTDLDARQRDYAQTVRNSGEALLTIINDILDFSKVEAGHLEIESIEFSVEAIVEDVVDLLDGPARSKGLDLVATIASSVPAVVIGDPGRLRQVLTNLIGNAIKFTQAGEVSVRVTCSGTKRGVRLLRFEVTDTGDGIEAEKLAVIFQPFVQGDSSTSRKYGGTGLGLAISNQLVSLMGGDYGVTSNLGVGSTFWFTIAVPLTETEEKERSHIPELDLEGVTVLVVVGSSVQEHSLSEYLTGWGMAVTCAGSSGEALGVLRAAAEDGCPFEVAVIDRRMPRVAGRELKDVINGDHLLSTRVVLMTSLGRDRLSYESELGVDASLTKPVHRKELLSCVRVALGLQVADVGAASGGETPSQQPALLPLVSGRLLLVEDNLVNRKVAEAMLRNAGYHVDTVHDGAAAVKAAGSRAYDAILMDCQMPVMNGYEATTAIRAQEGHGQHTPIIAMTAGARREDRERCLAEGMDNYLAKPLSKDAVLALVGQTVRRSASPSVAWPRATPVSRIERRVADTHDEHDEIGVSASEDGSDVPGESFARETGARIECLRGALAVGDAAAVAALARLLSESCGRLSCWRLAGSSRRLGDRAASGSLSEGEAELDEVESDFRQLRGTLKPRLVTKSVPWLRRVTDHLVYPESINVGRVVAKGDGRSKARTSLRGPPEDHVLLGNRILVVDDSPVGQRVATAMLESLGFRVDVVADGVEAVKSASLVSYQAILMDCQIPVLDGYQASMEIRRLLGPSDETPIIALTGSLATAVEKRCLRSGMNGVLTKPLGVKALAAALARWAPTHPSSEVGRVPLIAPTTSIVERLTQNSRLVSADFNGKSPRQSLTDEQMQR